MGKCVEQVGIVDSGPMEGAGSRSLNRKGRLSFGGSVSGGRNKSGSVKTKGLLAESLLKFMGR